MVVPSPCISVCTLDDITDICIGCYRTRQEIADWPAASDAARLAIVERCQARKSLEKPRSSC
ncbi:MAG: DUF1289 domain-containing protein [Rickettsiales bacterium]|nr:DUF1289 domain-containing protein [Rickettsiales bacterium]